MSIDEIYEIDLAQIDGDPELIGAVRLTLNHSICAFRDVFGKRYSVSENYRGRPAQIYLSQICKFSAGPQFARDYHIRAFGGGRTEVFSYADSPDALKLDVNSMYPYVFSHFPMYDPASAIDGANLDYDGWTFCKVVQPDVDFPVLPWTIRTSKGDEHTIHPIGEFQGVFSNRELLYAHETTGLHIREIFGGVHYSRSKNANIVKSVIARLYEQKRTAETKEARAAAKSVLNSGIGYYDRRPYHYWAVRMDRENLFPPNAPLVAKTKCTRNNVWGIFKCESKDGDKRNGIFRHVAAIARIELHRAISKLHEAGATLLYCDTDCLAFEGSGNILPIGDKLGEWKIENRGRFRAFGRKRYIAGDNAVVAGFSCTPEQISANGYYQPKAGVVIRLRETLPSRDDLEDDFYQTQAWSTYNYQGHVLRVFGQIRA